MIRKVQLLFFLMVSITDMTRVLWWSLNSSPAREEVRPGSPFSRVPSQNVGTSRSSDLLSGSSGSLRFVGDVSLWSPTMLRSEFWLADRGRWCRPVMFTVTCVKLSNTSTCWWTFSQRTGETWKLLRRYEEVKAGRKPGVTLKNKPSVVPSFWHKNHLMGVKERSEFRRTLEGLLSVVFNQTRTRVLLLLLLFLICLFVNYVGVFQMKQAAKWSLESSSELLGLLLELLLELFWDWNHGLEAQAPPPTALTKVSLMQWVFFFQIPGVKFC